MSAVEDPFITHVRELLAPLGEISVRRMFGGHGVYCDDLIIALLAEGQLWLKVDAQSKAEFEAAGATAFSYAGKGKPVAMSYYSVPGEGLDNAEQLRPWAQLALAAALRAAASKRDVPSRPTYPGTRKNQRRS
jgi:DNA transformation protein